MKITSLISIATAASLVSAGKFIPLSEKSSSVVQGAFIIEYEDGSDHAKANNFLNSHKVDYKVRGEFSVFNGASFNVKSGHSGEDLAKIPSVKRVWPVEIISVGKPKVTKNKNPTAEQLYGPHTMTGVDYVHKTLKHTGKGVKKPKQKSDPRDHCHGHGTHVAGIVGANARKVGAPHPFVGVAPEVTFGAYRVLDCNGFGSNEGIMFGMELAFNQGMHIINMSLGGGASYKTNPIAALADKLTAHGMAVVASAGNNGDDGIGMVGNTGLGDMSTSVASFDNVSAYYKYFKYASKEHPYLPSANWNKAINLPSSTTVFPLVQQDDSLQDGCDAASYPAAVKGKVVLVIGDFNRCSSSTRGGIALAAGAVGMLVQSLPYGFAGLTGTVDFPMASIGYMDAEDLKAEYKKNPANRFSWPSGEKNFKVEGGGIPSSFSSWGLDGELRIKPDISAPGGNIYSTFPVHMGSYAIRSGTSMAAPYTAGAHALLFSAHKKILRGQDARRILKSTPVPGRGFMEVYLTSVAKQGAGLINVKNAIQVKTAISPEHIQLLDTVHFAGKSVEVKIKNLGKKTTTYTLSHEASIAEVSYDAANTWPVPPQWGFDFAKVKFSANKVTVKAGQTTKVKVQFSQPATGKAEQFPLYSGYIIATPSGKDSVSVRIPYAGVKGDIAKVPIVDSDLGFPVFQINGGQQPLVKGQKIDFSKDEVYLGIRLGSHTPDLRVILTESVSGKFVGYLNTAFRPSWGPFGRNGDRDNNGNLEMYVYKWVGGQVLLDKSSTAPVTPARGGAYKVLVAAQHKLSKGSFPADFEVHQVAEIVLV